MGHGGKRAGAGRRKGSKNRRIFALTAQTAAAESKQTAAQRQAALRRQIALFTANNMTPEEIAAVLGFDEERLKAVFTRELTFGHAITKASLLTRLDDAGNVAANVAANKRLLDEIEPNAPLPGEQKNLGLDDPSAPATGERPRGVGKKEWAQRQAQAEDAAFGTPWDALLGQSDPLRKPQ